MGLFLKIKVKDTKNHFYSILLFWFSSKIATREGEERTGQDYFESQTNEGRNLLACVTDQKSYIISTAQGLVSQKKATFQ